MQFIAWIRKIKHALHECAESIGHTEERQRQQEFPRNQPMEVRAIVSFSDETVRDTKSKADREYATHQSIKKATWAAVVAASIYALIAAVQACQIRKQNGIATTALRQSTESFRIDERAWIEIEPIKPTFLSSADAKFPAIFTCNV